MKKITILSILGFVLALPAFGQTFLKQTTLSAAVKDGATTTISLTSTSGITAAQTVIYVADGSGEAMFVNTVGTGYVGVTRGYQNLGGGTPHLSGALVFYGPANAFATIQPTGSCTRASQTYLPVIAFGVTGSPTSISDCIGGVWVTGDFAGGTSPFRVLAPNPGAVAYTSINSTGTTLVAGTLYCNELDLPWNKLLTGVGILLGSTGGTDKHIGVLLDSAGNVIANSALAGATAGTASTYEQLAFTSPYYAVGPATYFACVQSNGTTATVRMEVTGTQDTYLTTSKTGSFGTIPTITVPTTFTTAVGPYSFLY